MVAIDAVAVSTQTQTDDSSCPASSLHPMLQGDARYTMFPVQYPDVWRMYKTAVSCFWTVEEIDFQRDAEHWARLEAPERDFIKQVLAFFAASDGIVNENLAQRFCREVRSAEARAFYSFQMAMESVHSEAYSLMIDTLIADVDEKERLLNAVTTIPTVAAKASWALRWIEDQRASFPHRLLAYAIVEGVFFSGSFCAIYWLNERGVMPALAFSNQLIARDETMHAEFSALLYSMTPPEERLTQDEAHAMAREALDIEIQFITEAIPCTMLGMSARAMADYVRFVADRLLVQLGYEPAWGCANPFTFMERISMPTKANFFEVRVGEYAKAHVGEASGGQGAAASFTTDAEGW
jgi:ribonucleotide reductase beta subunit family protein with ferritin-like domain